MDSSPTGGSKALEPSLPSVAGVKRPAASLLPAFEPLSSSPAFPRPAKRQSLVPASNSFAKYPTPVPTSSTGILSSSPPRVGLGLGFSHVASANGPSSLHRPGLQRTQSSVSERAPLSAVSSIELNENGETLLMGRSSNASHYQLSANRLISRIHIKARYIAASIPTAIQESEPENTAAQEEDEAHGRSPLLSPLISPTAAALGQPNRIEIVCNGWNGCKLHCQGRRWELAKGDTFTSETEGAEIMLDVQDARVLIRWPKRDNGESLAHLSDSSWEESPRPRAGATTPGLLQSSPLRRTTRIASPESPTPAHRLSNSGLELPDVGDEHATSIQIYEDASSDEQELPKQSQDLDVGASFLTEVTNSFSSELSDLHSDDEDGEHINPDEENDPIIHSFGPFGANLSNRLASFSTRSPKITQSPLISRNFHRSRNSSIHVASATGALSTVVSNAASRAGSNSTASSPRSNPSSAATVKPADSALEVVTSSVATAIPEGIDLAAISNHVINQLAFSRLSSNPLTTILNNLPAEERGGLNKDLLRQIIEGVPCIGIIPRQGKDAAGKPLESEYYYVPERDEDENRRAAVVDGLRKPSLRSCRKQHKQYYWKRPKTP